MAGATLSLGRGNAPKARYTPHGDGAVGWRGSHAAVVSLYFCVRSCPARPELVAALAAPDHHSRCHGARNARRRPDSGRETATCGISIEILLAPTGRAAPARGRRPAGCGRGLESAAHRAAARGCVMLARKRAPSGARSHWSFLGRADDCPRPCNNSCTMHAKKTGG